MTFGNMHVKHTFCMHLGTNIKRLREAKGLTAQQLADLAGNTGQSNLSKIERGEVWIGKEKLQQIAQALGVPIWELFRDPESDSTERGAMLTLRNSDVRRLQVLGYADAYYFVYSSPQHSGTKPRNSQKEAKYVLVDKTYPANSFSLFISDESMSPLLRLGQLAIFDPARVPKPNSVIAIHYRDDAGDWVVPRLFHDRGQHPDGRPAFEAVPRNRAFRGFRSDEDVEILGVLIEQRIFWGDPPAE